MRNYIRFLPLKQKIIAICMITSVSVVTMASIIFFATQYSINQNNLVKSTATLAKILSVNVYAAMIFNDSVAGNEILAALAEKPQIISAEILKLNGSVFATYISKNNKHQLLLNNVIENEAKEWNKDGNKKHLNQYTFFSSYLDLDQEIKIDSKSVGYIDIRSDLSQLHDALISQISIMAIVLLLVSFFGFLMINWMQTYITEPIQSLTSTIQSISNKQDYSLRADKFSNDELGTLTDYFNLMLEQIFIRDEELAVTMAQLQNANLATKKASQAKTDFLTSMSHEIRTPMNGVLGMVNLIMKTKLDNKQLHYAKTIHNSGITLLSIINDILDISKIEANKISLDKVAFNPRENVLELGNLFAQSLQTSDIKLDINISENFPSAVSGDPSRFNQILYNLLGNAIKFTKGGQIIINCCLKNQENEKSLLFIEIKDNGIGISKEKQSHLFEAFFQAHTEDKDIQSGTGLGLAIAKKLCAAMGGQIGVKSKLKVGSTFWFTVCLEQIQESDLIRDNAINDNKQPEEFNFGANILLVEDNIVNQEVTIGSLEYFGCHVSVANNGLEALDLFKNNSYDLIFMDFSMPILDGETASKHIRQLEKQQNLNKTPIIALTAHVVSGIKLKCSNAGMNDYLSKPFSLSQLFNILEKWSPKQEDSLLSKPPQTKKQKSKVLQQVVQYPEFSPDIIKQTSFTVINKQTIEQLRTIQQPQAPNIINKMINHYLQQTPKLMLQLENAVHDANAEQLWKTAHSLKSSSVAIGADLIAQTFTEIELMGRAGNLLNIPLEKVINQYQQVILHLHDYIEDEQS